MSKRDDILLPDELDQVINQAIERGTLKMKRDSRRKKYMKTAAVFVVALSTALTVSVNAVPSFAESLSNAGAAGLVKVLRFEWGRTTGGEITDGQEISQIEITEQGDSERITINLATEGMDSQVPGSFEITYLEYPYRLLVSLPGTRSFPGADQLPSLEGSTLVSGIHRIVTLDDSMERLVITLKRPVELAAQEQHDPAGIVIDLKAASEPVEAPAAYFVRSASYPFGEEGGVIEGMLRWEMGIDAAIIPDGAGDFVIDTGPYASEAEAEVAKEHIYSELGVEMHVELRGPGDLPAPIERVEAETGELHSTEGVFNGLADRHTAEIEIDGETISFGLADDISFSGTGIEEGSKIYFTYREEAGGRPVIIKIEKID